ncbi:MAG: restriction endonuclease subunit S, partial [Aeromonas sp.]
SFGPQVWTGEKVIFHYHIWKVIPDFSQIDKQFLFYFLEWDKELLKLEKGAGTTMIHVSKGSMEEREILVPPLTEQQRIVAILDEAFEAIATARANAEQNRQNARALFESYLQSVFSQHGEGWHDRQLASVCKKITVGHVGSMAARYKPDGIPFLRSQNILPFEVSLKNVVFIDAEFHQSLMKSRLTPGDVAIVRTGYPGTAAVIPPELKDANCSDLVIIRPGDEVNPHYLAAFFNSAYGKGLVAGKLVGAAQKHFNVTSAKEVMLHLPPQKTQSLIVAEIDELRAETQRLESLYQRKIAALDELKQSLLQQAFSGQL